MARDEPPCRLPAEAFAARRRPINQRIAAAPSTRRPWRRMMAHSRYEASNQPKQIFRMYTIYCAVCCIKKSNSLTWKSLATLFFLYTDTLTDNIPIVSCNREMTTSEKIEQVVKSLRNAKLLARFSEEFSIAHFEQVETNQLN